MDAIEENHCLFKWSPFDVRKFFSVVATPLQSMDVYEGLEVWPASLQHCNLLAAFKGIQ